MLAKLENVSKSFTAGVETIEALVDVSLAVSPGEFACVYGASGSGKSTLLNVLSGIESPDSGSVAVAGHALPGLDDRGRTEIRLRHMGIVFQSDNLLPEFTAEENVALPLMARGMRRTECLSTAIDALRSLDVADLRDRFPAKMSGGQRQRVGIARALAGDQEIVVADEPTGALDSRSSRQLFELLARLCRERNKAVVLATHDPIAREFATSDYQMTDGRLVA